MGSQCNEGKERSRQRVELQYAWTRSNIFHAKIRNRGKFGKSTSWTKMYCRPRLSEDNQVTQATQATQATSQHAI